MSIEDYVKELISRQKEYNRLLDGITIHSIKRFMNEPYLSEKKVRRSLDNMVSDDLLDCVYPGMYVAKGALNFDIDDTAPIFI